MDKKNEENMQTGYCRPPKRTQFKKGQSGNKKGRPKKTKTENLIDDFQAELNSFITVTENGKQMKITKQQAIVKKLVNSGMTSVRDIERIIKLKLAADKFDAEKESRKQKNKPGKKRFQGGVVYVDEIHGPAEGGILAVGKPLSKEEWLEKASATKLPASACREEDIPGPEFVWETEPPEPKSPEKKDPNRIKEGMNTFIRA